MVTSYAWFAARRRSLLNLTLLLLVLSLAIAAVHGAQSSSLMVLALLSSSVYRKVSLDCLSLALSFHVDVHVLPS